MLVFLNRWLQSIKMNHSNLSALLKPLQNLLLAGKLFFHSCSSDFDRWLLKLNDIRLVNGKELTNKDGVQIEKDVNNNKYSLTIPKANPTLHAGTLTIKASNLIGSVQHDLNLTILGLSLASYNNYFDIESTKIAFLN